MSWHEGVQVGIDDARGRYVEATRDIEPGGLLFCPCHSPNATVTYPTPACFTTQERCYCPNHARRRWFIGTRTRRAAASVSEPSRRTRRSSGAMDARWSATARRRAWTRLGDRITRARGNASPLRLGWRRRPRPGSSLGTSRQGSCCASCPKPAGGGHPGVPWKVPSSSGCGRCGRTCLNRTRRNIVDWREYRATRSG